MFNRYLRKKEGREETLRCSLLSSLDNGFIIILWLSSAKDGKAIFISDIYYCCLHHKFIRQLYRVSGHFARPAGPTQSVCVTDVILR